MSEDSRRDPWSYWGNFFLKMLFLPRFWILTKVRVQPQLDWTRSPSRASPSLVLHYPEQASRWAAPGPPRPANPNPQLRALPGFLAPRDSSVAKSCFESFTGLSLHAPRWRPVFCLFRAQVHFLCPLTAIRVTKCLHLEAKKPLLYFFFSLFLWKISSRCTHREKHVSNKRRKWGGQLGLLETVQMKFKEGAVGTVFEKTGWSELWNRQPVIWSRLKHTKKLSSDLQGSLLNIK